MADKIIPTPAELRQLLRYEPETGKLYWLPREGMSKFNAQFAGHEAFTAKDSRGYGIGTINYGGYYAHRVAWAIYHNAHPEFTIDHIDGNRINNRIINLRDVLSKVNSQNKRIPQNNTTGTVGVYWVKSRNLWRASISTGGKVKTLGQFHSYEDAVAVRKMAEERYGYHANHGSRKV